MIYQFISIFLFSLLTLEDIVKEIKSPPDVLVVFLTASEV